MAGSSNDSGAVESPSATLYQGFDNQATTMVDSTFAETIGLSMHNAVTSQMNAQMAASASVTNACARLLKAAPPATASATAPEEDEPIEGEAETVEEPKSKWYHFGLGGSKKKSKE